MLGIDIGSHYTKVVEIERRNRPRLINAFFFPTPYLAALEGSGPRQIETDSFLSQISKRISLKRLQTAKIGINVPTTSITAISLVLPQMPRKELMPVAIAEARRKMIPASGVNHVFDCSLSGERVVSKMTKHEVFVVRTERAYIDNCLNILKSIGVVPSFISPSCCAITNVLPKDIWHKDVGVAVIDMGLNSINISIYKQRKLFFFRNTAYGFQHIIRDLSHNLGFTEQEAEKVISEKEIPQVSFDAKDRVAIAEEIMRQKYEAGQDTSLPEAKREVNPLELRMLWQPHIERIIHELRRSLAYYNEQSEGYRVGHFFFLGGGAQVRNLQSTLATQIGGKCEILLPFKDMEIGLVKGQFKDEFVQTPIFAAAAGLALNSYIKPKEIINFLPKKVKRKHVVIFSQTLLTIFGFSLILIFGFGWLNALFINRSLNISLTEVESELNRIRGTIVSSRELKEREQIINQRSSQIDEIIKEAVNFYYSLKRLSQAIPADIFLTKLSIAESKEEENKYLIELSARVFTDYEQANRLIRDFRQGLVSSAYFTDINTTPLELEEISPELSRTEKDLPITSARIRDFGLKAQVMVRQ